MEEPKTTTALHDLSVMIETLRELHYDTEHLTLCPSKWGWDDKNQYYALYQHSDIGEAHRAINEASLLLMKVIRKLSRAASALEDNNQKFL